MQHCVHPARQASQLPLRRAASVITSDFDHLRERWVKQPNE
jgi:hypothetical protein